MKFRLTKETKKFCCYLLGLIFVFLIAFSLKTHFLNFREGRRGRRKKKADKWDFTTGFGSTGKGDGWKPRHSSSKASCWKTMRKTMKNYDEKLKPARVMWNQGYKKGKNKAQVTTFLSAGCANGACQSDPQDRRKVYAEFKCEQYKKFNVGRSAWNNGPCVKDQGLKTFPVMFSAGEAACQDLMYQGNNGKYINAARGEYDE